MTMALGATVPDRSSPMPLWAQVLDEFYGPFERLLEKNEDEIKRFEEQLDEKCPKCPTEGREPGNLIVKLGRYGKFIGCDNYPECSYIRNMDGTERFHSAGLGSSSLRPTRPTFRGTCWSWTVVSTSPIPKTPIATGRNSSP